MGVSVLVYDVHISAVIALLDAFYFTYCSADLGFRQHILSQNQQRITLHMHIM